MKESQFTKKSKTKKTVLGILHFLLVFGPLLFFFPYGFIIGTITTKLTMGLSVVISMVLAAISALVDVKHRAGLHKSIMWIFISAIMLVLSALSQIRAFIFIMAGTCLIDELFVCPAHEKARAQLITNREMDKRIG